MKLTLSRCGIVLFCAVFASLGCNLTGSVKPGESSPETPQVKVNETAVPAVNTPVPPPMPTKSKLHWGKYMCITECIDDEYLESYPVIGGVPPLAWAEDSMSVSVNQDGSINTGYAFFWIFTNSHGGEVCTNGEYQFDGKVTSGSYNSVDNILTVEMTGEETYGADVGGEHCIGADLKQQGTHQFIFAVNEDGNLVLCKPGETGEACLSNPMAILNQ